MADKSKVTTIAPGRITGPAGWYGPDLDRNKEWLLHLSAAEIAEIDAAIDSFRASGAAMQGIGTTTFPLPVFGRRLKTLLRELLDGRGFFMPRGLPVERYAIESAALAYLGI